MVNMMGYPPAMNFCPECGSSNIEANDIWHQDGRLICNDCGLECYCVEGDNSHADK